MCEMESMCCTVCILMSPPPGPSSGASNMDSLEGIWPVLDPRDDEEPVQGMH